MPLFKYQRGGGLGLVGHSVTFENPNQIIDNNSKKQVIQPPQKKHDAEKNMSHGITGASHGISCPLLLMCPVHDTPHLLSGPTMAGGARPTPAVDGEVWPPPMPSDQS